MKMMKNSPIQTCVIIDSVRVEDPEVTKRPYSAVSSWLSRESHEGSSMVDVLSMQLRATLRTPVRR
jgi:hypothetical protein